MQIRTYVAADLEICRSLWAEMVQQHRDVYEDPTIGDEDPGLEFDQHLERVGPDLVWIAFLDGKPAGLVSLIHEGEQAEVEPIVVSSEFRGKGIGRKLLEHAVRKARELGVLCLNVRPVARNREAVSFFHNAGFKTLGHLNLFMWLGPDLPGAWKTGPEIFGLPFDY